MDSKTRAGFGAIPIPDRPVEAVLALYAIGVFLSSYPPLVLTVGGTRALRPDWIFFVPVFAYVAISVARGRSGRVLSDRGSRLAVALVAIFVLSAAVNHLYDTFDALTILVQLLYVAVMFCCVVYLRITGDTLKTVFRVWIGAMVVVSVYVIYQSIALNHGLPFWNPYLGTGPEARTMYETNGYTRPVGLFSEPRWLSGFYLPGIAAMVGFKSTQSDLFEAQRADDVALGIVLLAFALVASISGYLSVGLLFGMGLLLPQTRRATFEVAALFGLLMTVLIGILSVLGSSFSTMIIGRLARVADLAISSISQVGSAILPDGSEGTSTTSSPSSTTDGPVTTQTDTTAEPTTTSEATTSSVDTTSPDTDGEPNSESGGSGGGIASYISPGSIGIRFARAITGLKAWVQHPILGIGPGQFPYWSDANQMTEKFPVTFANRLTELNSFWLQALVGGGGLALATLGAIWGEISLKIQDAFRRDLDGLEHLPACVLVIFVLFVDGIWGIGIVHPLRWFFPALVYSYVLEDGISGGNKDK